MVGDEAMRGELSNSCRTLGQLRERCVGGGDYIETWCRKLGCENGRERDGNS